MAKAELSDKELIDLCLAGNGKGYTQLYNKYARSIFSSIYRLVNNTAEAEDLLQEVFVMVFSNTERLKGLESFEAWTRRVAVNSSISHLRKRKMFFTDIDSMRGDEPVQEDVREELDWQKSQIEDIERAIAALPETTRTIVNLFLFEEMSQEEIGQTLGLSHTAVRSQYHRAKNRIAKTIKEKVCYGR